MKKKKTTKKTFIKIDTPKRRGEGDWMGEENTEETKTKTKEDRAREIMRIDKELSSGGATTGF